MQSISMEKTLNKAIYVETKSAKIAKTFLDFAILNDKPIFFFGPSQSGKTDVIRDKLIRLIQKRSSRVFMQNITNKTTIS